MLIARDNSDEAIARKYMPNGLKIIRKSDAIPQFVLCASESLPLDIREQIIKSLFIPK